MLSIKCVSDVFSIVYFQESAGCLSQDSRCSQEMSRAGSKKFSSSQKLEEEEGKESKRRPVSLGVQQPNQNRSCQPQAGPSAGSAKESADRRKDKLPVLTDRISHLGISNSSSRRNSCGPSSNSIPLPSSNTKIPLRRCTSNSSSSSSIRGTVPNLFS